MPTYQYVCTSCAQPLEAVQSFTDAPLTRCPACSGVLRKVFSSVGVVFKGSGFYRNDSREPGKKAETKVQESGGTAPKEGSKDVKSPEVTSSTAKSETSSGNAKVPAKAAASSST